MFQNIIPNSFILRLTYRECLEWLARDSVVSLPWFIHGEGQGDVTHVLGEHGGQNDHPEGE